MLLACCRILLKLICILNDDIIINNDTRITNYHITFWIASVIGSIQWFWSVGWWMPINSNACFSSSIIDFNGMQLLALRIEYEMVLSFSLCCILHNAFPIQEIKGKTFAQHAHRGKVNAITISANCWEPRTYWCSRCLRLKSFWDAVVAAEVAAAAGGICVADRSCWAWRRCKLRGLNALAMASMVYGASMKPCYCRTVDFAAPSHEFGCAGFAGMGRPRSNGSLVPDRTTSWRMKQEDSPALSSTPSCWKG